MIQIAAPAILAKRLKQEKKMTNSATGFDYRPTSYFKDLDPATLIVASILGEERRKDVSDRIASDDFDPLVWGDWITEPKLDDSVRSIIGQGHPRFLGGEYLPSIAEEEIEIARIVLASVTQDVYSIRARRQGKLIVYRVVDEYESTFNLAMESSTQPLSMKELIGLIDGSRQDDDAQTEGLVLSHLAWNIGENGNAESMRGFIAVSSHFYPRLAGYYDGVISRYLDSFLVKEEEIEEDDCPADSRP